MEKDTTDTDPSTDGKHTLVTNRDGKEEWVLISPYLPKHEYDFDKTGVSVGFYEILSGWKAYFIMLGWISPNIRIMWTPELKKSRH